jgi:adenine specific DNA methylase Mod
MPKDYSQLSKDDLIKIIEKLESRKKYGLIWDEEKTKEQFEKESENALPVLKEVKDKEIKTDTTKPINILIEGDNYHALSVLNYTHQNKIDVIYIDPPYNTGNKDFKYNDNYVDKEDTYRHSKWLSFMSKRLKLAKDLLKIDGAIFISINEDELAQLKLLCDEIFGDSNYLTTFTIKVRHEDRILKGDKDFHEVVEYLLLYRKSNLFHPYKRKKDNTSNKDYIYEIKELIKSYDKVIMGDKTVTIFKPGQYEIIKKEASENYLKKINIRGSIKEGNSSGRFYMKYIEPIALKNRGCLFKVPEMGNDKFGYRYFITPKTEKNINGSYFQGVPFNREDIKDVPYPNYFDFENEFNNVGYEGGVDFRNGKKPIAFIHKILEIGNCIDKKEAIILDFFAGSGSTGHAVLNFNKELGGKRIFILCTNNEANILEKELNEKGLSEEEIQEQGICRKVTYPRIEKAINGYKTSKGTEITPLGGNLKYFKTAFVKNSISRDDLKMRITLECTEMLCLREGVFEEVKTASEYRIFKQNNKVMGIYYALERDGLKQLKKELDNIKGEKILYCFTIDPLGLEKDDFADWDDVSLEAIPQPILDIYKGIYNL